MKRVRGFGWLCICSFLVSGCAISKLSEKSSGMFGGDRGRLQAAFVKIERGKTTLADLRKADFDFKDANVGYSSGALSLQTIFPNEPLLGGRRDKPVTEGEALAVLESYADLYLYRIPHKYIVMVDDVIYFSNEVTTAQGHDDFYDILFQKGGEGDEHWVVVYTQSSRQNIDTLENRHATFLGFLDFIGNGRASGKLIDAVPVK